MTTLTSSPSISPQPFSVPSSRSPAIGGTYRPSTPSSAGSTPLLRRKTSSASNKTTARQRDVGASTSAYSGSSAAAGDHFAEVHRISEGIAAKSIGKGKGKSRDIGTQ